MLKLGQKCHLWEIMHVKIFVLLIQIFNFLKTPSLKVYTAEWSDHKIRSLNFYTVKVLFRWELQLFLAGHFSRKHFQKKMLDTKVKERSEGYKLMGKISLLISSFWAIAYFHISKKALSWKIPYFLAIQYYILLYFDSISKQKLPLWSWSKMKKLLFLRIFCKLNISKYIARWKCSLAKLSVLP